MVCRSSSREQIATIWSSPVKSTRSTVTSTPSTRVLKGTVSSSSITVNRPVTCSVLVVAIDRSLLDHRVQLRLAHRTHRARVSQGQDVTWPPLIAAPELLTPLYHAPSINPATTPTYTQLGTGKLRPIVRRSPTRLAPGWGPRTRRSAVPRPPSAR